MPRLRIRDGTGTLRTIVRVRVRDETGTLRTIQRISGQFLAQLLPLFQAFAATVSPATVSAYGSSGAAASLTTSSVLAAPVGGTAAFGYVWTQVGSSPYVWTINTPATAGTSFTAAAVPAGVVTSATFMVTVTDAIGTTATAIVTAYANNGQPYDPSLAYRTDGCPTLETLFLLANDNGTGAGKEIEVADLRVGQLSWTRHELTLEWGAWPVTAISYLDDQPICALPGYPEVSPEHRFSLPVWLARLLPNRLRWFRPGWFVKPRRTATVAKITTGAGTYMIRRPGSAWRLSHNVKNIVP